MRAWEMMESAEVRSLFAPHSHTALDCNHSTQVDHEKLKFTQLASARRGNASGHGHVTHRRTSRICLAHRCAHADCSGSDITCDIATESSAAIDSASRPARFS